MAATLTTYLVLITGVEIFRISPLAASISGYALGVVVNYALNYRYTFSSSKKHRFVIPKFLTVMTVGMLINAGIMFIGIGWMGLNYLLAQLIAVMIVLTWSFIANRFWSFAS